MVIRQYLKYTLHSRVMMLVECEMSIVGDCASSEINRHRYRHRPSSKDSMTLNWDDFLLITSRFVSSLCEDNKA